MTEPRQGVCSPWTDISSVQASECCPDSVDAYLTQEVIDVASDLLFELSGRRFPGACEDVVRPCAQSIGGHEVRSFSYNSYRWTSWCHCNAGPRCGCSRGSVVQLGGYPITEIDEVKVDGVALDDSLYRVDDWRYLRRLPDPDGRNPGWPCCQNIDLATTEEDTFEVSYTYGYSPPVAGQRAAAYFACQLYLSCVGDESCQLPDSVQSITRQGVSMLLINPGELFANGTGLPRVDLFIRTYNRSGGRGPARISTPDIPRHITRAGT